MVWKPRAARPNAIMADNDEPVCERWSVSQRVAPTKPSRLRAKKRDAERNMGAVWGVMQRGRSRLGRSSCFRRAQNGTLLGLAKACAGRVTHRSLDWIGACRRSQTASALVYDRAGLETLVARLIATRRLYEYPVNHLVSPC